MAIEPTTVAVLTPEQIEGLAAEAALQAARAALGYVAGDLERLAGVLQEQRGILNKHQVMTLLSITDEGTLRSYINEKGLRCYRPGRSPLFLLEDVVAFIKRHPDP